MSALGSCGSSHDDQPSRCRHVLGSFSLPQLFKNIVAYSFKQSGLRIR